MIRMTLLLLLLLLFLCAIPLFFNSKEHLWHKNLETIIETRRLPNITIISAGGTIAGAANASEITTSYRSGTLGITEVIKDIRRNLENIANIHVDQFLNIDSLEINSSLAVRISHRIGREVLNPCTQGIVLTLGTDLMSVDNWSHFFGEAFKCLKPDGYLETHEQSFRLIHQASDDPVDPTTQSLISALNRWNKVFSDLGKRLDRPFLAVDHRTQMDLMKAGFTDLEVWRKWMPIGPWVEDLELPGELLQEAWEKGLERMLNRPATELGWSPHEATMLGMEIRKALRSPKLNVKVKVVIIVGRKPGQL
ncbi:hypothetical protein EDB81DRAFT_953113 [Dactylonectria macrodidyma]|uniref:L-asparaginase N-terminal domain-containing protein n=1 Tax=Dactylonectria macrodidyma TaxID=307937 RepID=A0A9P9DAZ9_9HYPO|nr:hypothetical protein EDB81DRAFT_953113 [Dactylonectria macrodidyma]